MLLFSFSFTDAKKFGSLYEPILDEDNATLLCERYTHQLTDADREELQGKDVFVDETEFSPVLYATLYGATKCLDFLMVS